MDAHAAPQRHTTALALALSTGLHLIVLLTLDLSPGDWRHGLMPALRVELKPVARHAAAGELPATPESADPAPHGASLQSAATPAEAGPTRDAAPDQGSTAPQPQAGSSLPVPERYFKRSEVDVAAEPQSRGPLIFPEDALMWRLAGTVRARVYISETGTVDSVQVVEAIPPGYFEAAAVEALRQVRYRPAEIRGQPVKSQKLIEVKFDPYEGSPDAPASTR